MKTQKNVLILVVTFGLWLGLILGCNTTTQGTREAGDPIKISAEDLYKAYQSNEADADELYKGKTLIVTGTVGAADTKDREVTFIDARRLSSGGGTGVLVYCLLFAADQVGAISKLKAGQIVSVKGTCTGRARVLGMTVEQVSLRDCVVH